MRIILIFICLAGLFIGTCSEGVQPILTDFQIHFMLSPEPTWSDFWKVYTFHSKIFIIHKIGHFSGFFILSLLMTDFGRDRKGLLWAIGYGVLTELIQPFFDRDARVLDMLINTAGVYLAYYLSSEIKSLRKK
ncbi:VanZ family protein [Paenibacillus sp. JSM ZJ436]|uniref:VanZ family protein n=1 Tax=Paenibacillus sp. JSM ZJ436 TaxID=3376190 RepID=UPI00378D99EB